MPSQPSGIARNVEAQEGWWLCREQMERNRTAPLCLPPKKAAVCVGRWKRNRKATTHKAGEARGRVSGTSYCVPRARCLQRGQEATTGDRGRSAPVSVQSWYRDGAPLTPPAGAPLSGGGTVPGRAGAAPRRPRGAAPLRGGRWPGRRPARFGPRRRRRGPHRGRANLPSGPDHVGPNSTNGGSISEKQKKIKIKIK